MDLEVIAELPFEQEEESRSRVRARLQEERVVFKELGVSRQLNERGWVIAGLLTERSFHFNQY